MSDFDAIVVGSGMSGGWTAKELSERGLKVLVLERGPEFGPEHAKDSLTPWEEAEIPPLTQKEKDEDYRIQRHVYAFSHVSKHLWVKDSDHPYETTEGKPYIWRRGYHLGGRSIMWARQSYRWAPIDFEANKKDGYGVDWPIRYEDLAPWYDHVERFAGISGSSENLPQLPDSQFLPPFELTCIEEDAKERIEAAFPGRKLITGRAAHLREATAEHNALGRGRCLSRSRCEKGCIYGAYFSAVSATLPAARRTGNATIVTDAIVDSLEHDPATGRVTGVRVIDRNTMERTIYRSKLVFLNASAIASASILLNSTSDANPNGLANSSGQVGRNMMDHVSGAEAFGIFPDAHKDKYYFGRRPNGIYIPRYVNLDSQEEDFVRGFAFQGNSGRLGWSGDRPGIGEDFKAQNRTPGPWYFRVKAFGEVLPHESNRMFLHATKTDKWGVPIPVMDVTHRENEQKMIEKASRDAKAMVEATGAVVTRTSEDAPIKLTDPGDIIHEMGTARMGRDPKTSVLNGWNQAHDVENLFISDGACMTSSACQNPSLTYMALAARAANHAADLLKEGAL
ncbi:MAG: GMC family oxidoreductase [Pseudomonadota bacterium]